MLDLSNVQETDATTAESAEPSPSPYLNDIPLSLAVSAHNGTSFAPERRGDAERNGYAQTLTQDLEMLRAQAIKGGTLHLLDAEFARYRAGYRERVTAYLSAKSRCISWMITGPSNFPAARAQKRSRTADRRLSELVDFRKRALDAITRTLRPELAPIKTSDANALDRLQAELAQLEALQTRMKAINAAHKKFKKTPESLDKSELSESDKKIVREYVPPYSWEPHPFAPYQLSNNNANVRRVKERIAAVSQLREKAEQGDTEETVGACRIVQAFGGNRVRVYFPGKPSEAIRSDLKSHGFRWSPREGAWQRHLSSGAIEHAQRICRLLAVSAASSGAEGSAS